MAETNPDGTANPSDGFYFSDLNGGDAPGVQPNAETRIRQPQDVSGHYSAPTLILDKAEVDAAMKQGGSLPSVPPSGGFGGLDLDFEADDDEDALAYASPAVPGGAGGLSETGAESGSFDVLAQIWQEAPSDESVPPAAAEPQGDETAVTMAWRGDPFAGITPPEGQPPIPQTEAKTRVYTPEELAPYTGVAPRDESPPEFIESLFDGNPVDAQALDLGWEEAAMAEPPPTPEEPHSEASMFNESMLPLPPDLGFGVGDVLPPSLEATGELAGNLFGQTLADEDDGLEDILASTFDAQAGPVGAADSPTHGPVLAGGREGPEAAPMTEPDLPDLDDDEIELAPLDLNALGSFPMAPPEPEESDALAQPLAPLNDEQALARLTGEPMQAPASPLPETHASAATSFGAAALPPDADWGQGGIHAPAGLAQAGHSGLSFEEDLEDDGGVENILSASLTPEGRVSSPDAGTEAMQSPQLPDSLAELSSLGQAGGDIFGDLPPIEAPSGDGIPVDDEMLAAGADAAQTRMIAADEFSSDKRDTVAASAPSGLNEFIAKGDLPDLPGGAGADPFAALEEAALSEAIESADLFGDLSEMPPEADTDTAPPDLPVDGSIPDGTPPPMPEESVPVEVAKALPQELGDLPSLDTLPPAEARPEAMDTVAMLEAGLNLGADAVEDAQRIQAEQEAAAAALLPDTLEPPPDLTRPEDAGASSIPSLEDAELPSDIPMESSLDDLLPGSSLDMLGAELGSELGLDESEPAQAGNSFATEEPVEMGPSMGERAQAVGALAWDGVKAGARGVDSVLHFRENWGMYLDFVAAGIATVSLAVIVAVQLYF